MTNEHREKLAEKLRQIYH